MGDWLVIIKLQQMCKEAVSSRFYALSRNSPLRVKKGHEASRNVCVLTDILATHTEFTDF
jgi:hypothetical protein